MAEKDIAEKTLKLVHIRQLLCTFLSMIFLSILLKDQPYVEMVYMTGILPIAKYSSGSELNMFCEYTMVNEEKYNAYFGFTDEEVDELYTRYQARG